MGEKAEKQTVLIQNAIPRAPVRQLDPPRDEPRCRVRIKLRPGVKAYIAPGQRVRDTDARSDGWIYLEPIYESDVERLQASLETNVAGIKNAEAAHKRHFERFAKKYVPAGGDPKKTDKALDALESRYTGSVEAEFFHQQDRGIHPLVAVEVLEEGLAPPETDDQKRSRVIAHEVGRALRIEAIPGEAREVVDNGEIDALRDENAKLRREASETRTELRELRAMVDSIAKAQQPPAAAPPAAPANPSTSEPKGKQR